MAVIPLDPPEDRVVHRVNRRLSHLMRWRMTKTGRFYLRCVIPGCNVLSPDPGRRYADPGYFEHEV